MCPATFEPEVLKVYAKHYQTGEVIPADLIEKLDKSGKYGQGFATTEYLAASLLDMDFHVLTDVPADLDVMKFEEETLGKRGLLKQIPSRYRTTYFNHTMGGGYTAGYYSYIWAEVLDADAYEAYKETGDIFNQEVAGKFRNYILTPGGIDDAMDMYKNFRNRRRHGYVQEFPWKRTRNRSFVEKPGLEINPLPGKRPPEGLDKRNPPQRF